MRTPDVTPEGVLGEGLLLRPSRPGDRTRMLELAHDPLQVAVGVPVGVPLPATEDDLDARVAGSVEAFRGRTPGDLVVVRAEAPEVFLASVSWRHDVPRVLAVADVGYAVHPDARGAGVASRALRVLVTWLLRDPSGPSQARVQLDHSVENAASCRVALAAAMRQEGVRRGFLPLRGTDGRDGPEGRRHDVCLHGVLPGDLVHPTHPSVSPAGHPRG